MNSQELLQAVGDCIRYRHERAGANDCSLSLSDDEWSDFLQFVVTHRIAPFIFDCLKESNAPPRVKDALQALHTRNALRNLGIFAEASRIFSVFNSMSVRVMGLKGIHLAGCVYSDVSLRTMADIDLLVMREDLERASECLRGLGYSASEEVEPWTHHHLPAFVKQGAASVEVHWTIPPTHAFAIDLAGIWEGSRELKIGEGRLLVPSHEHTLCMLSVHTIYHHKMRSGLRPLVDVAEIARRAGDEMDWDLVGRIARQWRASTTVALMLYLSREIASAPISADVIQTIAPGGLRPDMISWAITHASLIEPQYDSPSPTFAQLWGPMEVFNKVKLVASHLLLPGHQVELMYPGMGGPAKRLRGQLRYLRDRLRAGLPSIKRALKDRDIWLKETSFFQQLIDRK